jgi:hypothetical protein
VPRLLYRQERDLVPIVEEAVWAPGPENLASVGMRSLDRSSCSELLSHMHLQKLTAFYKAARHHIIDYNLNFTLTNT